jgi:hypothetical protein
MEAGILLIKWIASTANEAVIFTKNLDEPTFQRYTNIISSQEELTLIESAIHHISE